MKRGIWWASFLVCGSASAQEGVRWQYSAPAECPSEQQFRALVRARLLGDPQASEAARNPSDDSAVSVEVRLEPSQHRATLVLKEPDAAPVERVVNGDSCDELVSGLALITALAFGAARESQNTTVTALPQAAEPAASAPPAQAAPLAQLPPAQTTHSEPARNKASAAAPQLAVELGAGGWLSSWSAPNLGLGADLFVRVAPQALASWSVRVSALYSVGSANIEDRLAEFRFFGGRAEGCPLSRTFYQQRLTGEACLGLELGALSGRGQASSALLEGASDTVFTATALITGRTRARFGQRFFVEAQGDLGLPLLRHEFVFEDPSQRIFRTPALGFSARLGLGVQFP